MTEEQAVDVAPVAQKENTKLAIWAFLGGEVVFFVSLILLIVFTRMTTPNYETQFRSHLTIPVIALNTFVLVTSSFFVVRALEAISARDDNKGMGRNLVVVVILGILFLGGQAFEWTTLFGEGINLKSSFGSPFYTVTGIHGTHVFIGIIWAIFLLIGNRRRPFSRGKHQRIENFGLYWHFVDIVWIVLFTVIYLI
ncbi:MAG: cytochrome c oxidase subunit 3 [Anaerolineales bacterium]|jgi:cytochrome c oxidase subunit 3/cytochrome o ubiquinol oxidase subunit 3